MANQLDFNSQEFTGKTRRKRNRFFLILGVVFLLFGSVTLLLIYNLILMYKKKKKFPKLAIFTLWGGVCVGAIIYFMFSETIEKIIIQILWSLILPIILTAYLRNSKRVKNTFVK